MVNKDWLDILVLEDYLDGKLDAKSMNRVERAALEDPFVAEALAGLSASPKRSLASLSLLQKQLHERIAEQQAAKKSTVITWQRLSIAATAAVVFISVGIIFWMKQVSYQQSAANQPKKVEVTIAPRVENGQVPPAIAEKDLTDVGDKLAASPKNALSEKASQPLSQQQARLSKVPVAASANSALRGKSDSSSKSAISSALMAASVIKLKVTDENSGKPIFGANIYLSDGDGKIKPIGSANRAGEFTIPADSVDKGQEIIVSYISYKTKKLAVKPNELLAVSLQEEKNNLDEVVIRGYQKRSRETTTGSSYIISGKEVKDAPVSNVEELLQGKVAGLNIQNSTGFPSTALPVWGWPRFKEYLIKGNKYSSEAKPGSILEYRFTVKNGKPINIKVIKGLSKKYDREVIRLIKEGPDWQLPDQGSSEVTVKLEY